MAFTALTAVSSNTGSPLSIQCAKRLVLEEDTTIKSLPVSLDSVPNSMMNEEQHATHVTGVSVGGTPYLRLMVPYGRPVGVVKAGNSLRAKDSAMFNKGPSHGQPGARGIRP